MLQLSLFLVALASLAPTLVSPSQLTHTFRFPLCRCLLTLTERLWTVFFVKCVFCILFLYCFVFCILHCDVALLAQTIVEFVPLHYFGRTSLTHAYCFSSASSSSSSSSSSASSSSSLSSLGPGQPSNLLTFQPSNLLF